jgi:xanthine/CO dehydrogenase XdhC/CoxF family maturation factor
MKEIEKVIEAYDQTHWDQEQAALGTVVKVEESAYRRVGARLYVTSSGNWVGGISGGCLEGDALKRARMAIERKKSSIVVYDTLDDDSHQIGVGLGCNGRIEVMFTPVSGDDENNPIEFLRSITSTRRTAVLLQILRQEGRDESLMGRFFPEDQQDDLARATGISVSELDKAVGKTREKGKSQVFVLPNAAGQEYEILVELIRPKVKLICAGDNYDVNAFVRIATELGWEVHVAGKLRKLDRTVFGLAHSVCSYADLDQIPIDDHTAVVLMSHDYKIDLSLIQKFAGKAIPYLGMLGPRKRLIKMQKELKGEGQDIDLTKMVNLYSPTGLDIGAESPEEIALSIVAEIIAVLRGREGYFLRNRQGPIHERD